jgi:hypothetical protein
VPIHHSLSGPFRLLHTHPSGIPFSKSPTPLQCDRVPTSLSFGNPNLHFPAACDPPDVIRTIPPFPSLLVEPPLDEIAERLWDFCPLGCPQSNLILNFRGRMLWCCGATLPVPLYLLSRFTESGGLRSSCYPVCLLTDDPLFFCNVSLL